MIKRFARYYRPHKKLLILDLISAFIISAIDLIYPMVTRHIINDVIPNNGVAIIFQFGLILLGIYIIRMFLEYIVGYYGHVLGVRMEYDMRRDIFNHIQTLDNKFFDNTKTGHLMSKIVNDLNDITEIAHHGPEDLFISLIKITGAFVLLSYINLQLTLIVFTIIPSFFNLSKNLM